MYAETGRCRRAELLAYFGDHYDPPCGRCDNDPDGAGTASRAGAERSERGRRVRHRLWGEGTLLHQDDHELIVVFDEAGYRTLTPAALSNGVLVETGPVT
jgi:ATP-dependent DNA helicase RecQ